MLAVLSAAAATAPAATLQQYPIPGTGAAAALVSGADGALWFTEPQADRIGRMTTAGVFTQYAVTPRSQPLGIAAGPDGAVWFTEAAADRIGRITTTGVLAEYPVTAGSVPTSIATGPDGGLWFTELGGDRVGRISTAGVVAEYAVPPVLTVRPQPFAIAAGPDGGVWFTELGEARIGQIGRIDPATLKITAFPASPAGSLSTATQPGGITAGPDGALWFTEQAANMIGRIAPSGVLTEFNAGPGPFGITLSPAGTLWFTQSGAGVPGAPSLPGSIGRLTITGALAVFPLRPINGASPSDIAVGPDGAIWITDGPAIARLSGDLTAPVPVVSGLSMTNRSFRVAAGPRRPLTAFRLRVSSAADVRILILRLQPGKLRGPGDCRLPRPQLAGRPACVARTLLVTLDRPAAHAGRLRVDFTGRDATRRPLPAGRYVAVVEADPPVFSSTRPPSRTIGFTIAP